MALGIGIFLPGPIPKDLGAIRVLAHRSSTCRGVETEYSWLSIFPPAGWWASPAKQKVFSAPLAPPFPMGCGKSLANPEAAIPLESKRGGARWEKRIIFASHGPMVTRLPPKKGFYVCRSKEFRSSGDTILDSSRHPSPCYGAR